MVLEQLWRHRDLTKDKPGMTMQNLLVIHTTTPYQIHPPPYRLDLRKLNEMTKAMKELLEMSIISPLRGLGPKTNGYNHGRFGYIYISVYR